MKILAQNSRGVCMITANYEYILGLNYIGICNFSILVFVFEQIIVKLTSFKFLCKEY